MSRSSELNVRLKTLLSYYYYGAVHRHPSIFTFDGERYRYLYHKYNGTWRSERAVEVPIVWQWMQKYSGAKVLEVGNVLSHYNPARHTILDKYEHAPGVINTDVVEFQPREQYDLIVSISTMEHVGFDETPRDDSKLLRGVSNLRSLLAPGGILLMTLPIGQNPKVAELVDSKQLSFDRMGCLKKISRSNKYEQTNWAEIREARYDEPFPCANGLVIGRFSKQR